MRLWPDDDRGLSAGHIVFLATILIITIVPNLPTDRNIWSLNLHIRSFSTEKFLLSPFQLSVVLVLVLPSQIVGVNLKQEDTNHSVTDYIVSNNILIGTLLKFGGKVLGLAGHLGNGSPVQRNASQDDECFS